MSIRPITVSIPSGNPWMSLAEIAEAIGFRYDTYFVKQFKSKIGQTPTEYRQSFWEEKDNRLAKKVE